MAELRKLAAQFEAMNPAQFDAVFTAELAKAARPFQPAVRAAILNIPTHGDKHTGLRARIASCVQVWAEVNGPVVSVGVEVNSALMPSGQKSLPLMMDGEKLWRHPVYGNREVWVAQEAHPYFWGAMSAWGPATHRAAERAADLIAAKIAG